MRVSPCLLLMLAAGAASAQVTLVNLGGGPGSNSQANVFTGSDIDRCPDTIGVNPNRQFDASQLVDSATSDCVSSISVGDAAGDGRASYFISEVAGTITQITASAEGNASCSVPQEGDSGASAQGFGTFFVNVEVTSRVLASITAGASSGGNDATAQVRVSSPFNCLNFATCTLLNKVCSTTTSNGCFPPLGGFVDDLPDSLALDPGIYRFDISAAVGVFNNISVRDAKSGTASAAFTVTFASLDTTGACCLSDGICEERTEAACALAGGTYQGDGTTCATVSCPEPRGACCLAPGECDFLTQAECEGLSGTYRGDGVPCEEADCGCEQGWATAGGGAFDNAASWDPEEVPETCDELTFENGGEFDVTFGSNVVARRLRIVNASPRFSGGNLQLSGTDVCLAVGSASAPAFTLLSGQILGPLGEAQIGTAAGSPGEFTLGSVDGAEALFTCKRFDLGIGVAAKANVLKGGNLLAGAARIGVTSPEPSIMNLLDGGVLDLDSGLIVGNAGDGVLNAFGGSKVFCDELAVAVAGIGKLRLSDPDTSLRARGKADIGFGELAELSIDKQATFTTDDLLLVGRGGAATITVSEQGVLNANEVRIGFESREECFVNIKQGAQFNVSTEIGIGFGSDATLSISEGGVATSGELTLGIVGLGTLNVADENSRVNVSGNVVVGFAEAAELVVEKNASMRVTGNLTAGQGGRAELIVDFGTLEVLGDIQLGNGEFAELLALAATINAGNIRVGGPSFGKALVSIASVLNATTLRVEPNGEFKIENATLNVPTISFFGTNFIEKDPRKQTDTANVINGNVTFGAGSVTVFSVADGANSLLRINGVATLGGIAEVRFADDANLIEGQDLAIIEFAQTPVGTFSAFRFPTRNEDFSANTRVENGQLILNIINPGSPATTEGEGEGDGGGGGSAGCNGCGGKSLPLSKQLGDAVMFFLGLSVLLGTHILQRQRAA